jgi:hypothetical protein
VRAGEQPQQKAEEGEQRGRQIIRVGGEEVVGCTRSEIVISPVRMHVA